MAKKKLRSTSPSKIAEKKSASSRPRWSRENEFGLLDGILIYRELNDSFHMSSFTDYMRKSNFITMAFSEDSLRNKMGRLRDNYLKTVQEKGIKDLKDGPDSDFFKLCHKIWGSEISIANVSVEKGKKSKQPMKEPPPAKKQKNEAVEKKQNGKGKEDKGRDLGETETETDAMEKEEIWVKYSWLVSCIENPIINNVHGLKALCKQKIEELDDGMLKDWDNRWKELKKVEVEAVVEREKLLKEILEMLQK